MGQNKQLILTTPNGKTFHVKSKSGDLYATLTWSPEFSERMTKQLQAGQAQLDSEIMRIMQPYMPLAAKITINAMYRATDVGSGLIQIKTPGAKRAYRSNAPVGKKGGSLRGPYYFHRMKADKKQYISNFAMRVMGAERVK